MLFVDDAKIQAQTKCKLRNLLDESETWTIGYGMIWSTPTGRVIQNRDESNKAKYMLSGKENETAVATKYLVKEITHNGVTVDRALERIDSTIKTTQIMRVAGLHEGKIYSSPKLRPCKMMVLPRATYGLHLKTRNRGFCKQMRRL